MHTHYIFHKMFSLVTQKVFSDSRTITSLNGISGYGFDLVRGTNTLDVIKSMGFPSGKYLFAGVVDGRNIWANDLAASINTLQALEAVVGKGSSTAVPFLEALKCKKVPLKIS